MKLDKTAVPKKTKVSGSVRITREAAPKTRVTAPSAKAEPLENSWAMLSSNRDAAVPVRVEPDHTANFAPGSLFHQPFHNLRQAGGRVVHFLQGQSSQQIDQRQ